jgi:hypothetical protein
MKTSPALDQDAIKRNRIMISSPGLSMILRKTGFHFSGSCPNQPAQNAASSASAQRGSKPITTMSIAFIEVL